MSSQLLPQKFLGIYFFASVMMGLCPLAQVRAEACAEPLGLVKKNLLANLNALSGIGNESLGEVKNILSRPSDPREYQTCLDACRRSSGAPEKCPSLCENENVAMNVSEAAQRLVSQLKISDLLEVPSENFFAGFFMQAPNVATPSWGYEISITDPFEKHSYTISVETRARYMLENAPGKSWTLSRCTARSLIDCRSELVSSDVLDDLKRCP